MRKLNDLARLVAILALPALVVTVMPLLAAAPGERLAAGAGGGGGGKEIFLAQKCNVCHSIASQSITMTSKSSKAPDLSDIGTGHPSAWLAQWLKKEVAATDGKKHMVTFKGTDAELQTLADWLATLKK